MSPKRLIMPLFSPTMGTLGGLTRAIAVANAAIERGFELAFCASGSVERTLRQRGYRVYTLPSPTMLGLPKIFSRMYARRSKNVSIPVKPGKSFGSVWFVFFVSGNANRNYLKRLVAAELEAFRDFRADRVFTDLDLGAYLSASIAGLPLACAFQGVLLEGKGTLFWNMVRGATDFVLKAYQQPLAPPEELAFGKHVLKVIPSIPALEGVDGNQRDICYVGQLLGEIQAEKQAEFQPERGKHYIFAYLGTGAVPMKTLRKVLPSLIPPGDARTIIVGGAGPLSLERMGAVEFRDYVSADALLPHCDWTICHGGQNTIIQSLLHGVPLLVFPGPIFERRYNAQKVQECGAGMMGELPDFTPQWLLPRLEQKDRFSTQARRLGEQISTYGGAQQAVEAIASWDG